MLRIAFNIVESPFNATKFRPLRLQVWMEALGNYDENQQLENWIEVKHTQSNIFLGKPWLPYMWMHMRQELQH